MRVNCLSDRDLLLIPGSEEAEGMLIRRCLKTTPGYTTIKHWNSLSVTHTRARDHKKHTRTLEVMSFLTRVCVHVQQAEEVAAQIDNSDVSGFVCGGGQAMRPRADEGGGHVDGGNGNARARVCESTHAPARVKGDGLPNSGSLACNSNHFPSHLYSLEA